jgi:hypothetical protein
MRYLTAALIVLSGILTSCEDDIPGRTDAGFVTAIESDLDVAPVGSVLLSDNGVITVCRTVDEDAPGVMYKTDGSGEVIWTKRLPPNNRTLWQVCDLPGNGFVTIGRQDASHSIMDVCVFDDEGGLRSVHSVPWRFSNGTMADFSPIQMLRLSNGNFVFAGNMSGIMQVCMTTGTFDTLVQKTIRFPGNPQRFGALIRGICELPDSTIAIATSFSKMDPPYLDFNWFTYLYRLDYGGEVKSLTVIGDSLHQETPSALLPLDNTLVAITGRMGRTNDGSGTFVNYLNNSHGILCAGEINTIRFTREGRFLSRHGIRNYPANGLAMSARPTGDGGAIVCGTVGQTTMTNIVSPTRIYLMKIDAGGAFAWSKIFSTTYPSLGVDAIQTPDGGYVVAGYEKAVDRHFNAIVIKTDADGNQ